MKQLLIIIAIFFSFSVAAQPTKIKADTTVTPSVDSMDLKVISMKDFADYLEKINQTIQKQFNITEVGKYQEVLKIIQSVYAEADKKRRSK